ncbi:MAG: DUF4399 domain-containing protein [Acidimicrobiales bacterium]|nr:DUF4399 domain-containing protein [Acidimicrobiales bacterium]
MRSIFRLLAPLAALSLIAAGCGDDDDDDDAATEVGADEAAEADEGDTAAGSVSLTSPSDGSTVARRFDVVMDADGIDIEPAGEVRDGAGHFHVMVDVGCMEPGETVPKDDEHVHFGKGQDQGQLFLEPGEHDLCLQVADGAHVALDVTDEISITVDGEEPFVTLGVPGGETLSSPVGVTMEANGVEIEPAGEVRDGAGHFHLMVDAPCLEPGEVIPKDDAHLHFGDGSTETDLELSPGEHTLCLQVGDGAHEALPVTHLVTVVIA